LVGNSGSHLEHHLADSMAVHLVESMVVMKVHQRVLHLVEYWVAHSAANLVVYLVHSKAVYLVEMKVGLMEHWSAASMAVRLAAPSDNSMEYLKDEYLAVVKVGHLEVHLEQLKDLMMVDKKVLTMAAEKVALSVDKKVVKLAAEKVAKLVVQ
jgi:hypothetical protein